MNKLNLDSFCIKDADIEINQYKILSGLKHYQSEFNKSRLYPHLAELVYLIAQLEEIQVKKKQLTMPLPKGIKNNTAQKNVFVEIVDKSEESKDFNFDLIEWAMPKIKEVVDEAYIFYSFIEENMSIHHVGTPPLFKNNGYLLIPDHAHHVLQVHKYEYSVYSSTSKPFSSLKTNFVEIADALNFSGEEEIIKVKLVKKYKERANIATYICENEYDFPFDQTIFPIAKRKLLNYLTT